MAGLVESGWTDGPVNIGLSETVSVRELVSLLCRLAGRSPELVCDTSKPEGRFVKSSDPARLFVALPDFVPRVSLEAGLERMIAWYRSEFP